MAHLICCEYPAHPPADGSSTAKGSADTFGRNVTVCALLLSLWSWVRRLLLVPPECYSCWQNGTKLYQRHLETVVVARTHTNTRTSQHFVPHARKGTPRTITKLCDPNTGLNSVLHRVYITAHAGVFTRLLYPQNKITNARNLNHCSRTDGLSATEIICLKI